jgi:glycosyltransferase involved in cell wall biosynthesis
VSPGAHTSSVAILRRQPSGIDREFSLVKSRRFQFLSPITDVRILHVIPRLAIECGGPVTAVLGMTSALKRAGVEVRLLTTDHWWKGIPNNIDCEPKIFHCLYGPWQWSPDLKKALPGEIGWADVVNLHTLWSYPGTVAARACRAAGVPYIVRPCGMLDQWSLGQKTLKKRIYAAMLERQNINGAAALWFTSEGEREGARSFNYSCTDAVIPLGLAPAAYNDLPPCGSFRILYPEVADNRLILFLGRLTPKKQTDLLLKAFAQLSTDFPDTSLVIAGPAEGTFLSELRQLATNLGIASRTLFTGPLRESEVQAALMDAEVFVLPSLHENFGVSVIEAMACGVPVILSDLVGLAESVREAKAGFTIPPDENSLASALRQVLSDPAVAREMGANGRKLALERFTWDGIVPSLLDLYRGAVEGSALARRNGID